MARRLVEEFFHDGRWRIASELAQHWQWRSGNGRFKLRSTLAILVGLEARGCLSLPPPLIVRGPVRNNGDPAGAGEGRAEQSGRVSQYRPFHWQLVNSVEQRRQWRGVLTQYHYLGAPGLVGAHLKYLVYSQQGEMIGALGWQSAVERLDCRDRLVGVDGQPELRARFLAHAVNNVRFLILPWWRVRHVASAVLAEGLERLQRDWPKHYGAPVWLVESFIDRSRFSGASYRAANWVAIGWSRGYAKRQGQFIYHGQPKEIYAYVEPVPKDESIAGAVARPMGVGRLTVSFSGFLPEKALYNGFLAPRRRVVGGGVAGRTRCSSPRSSNSHCTVSPPSKPIAAAKARGKLT